ncbi:MAG: hypothetical protein H0X38_13440 [Planctomycetes bacterium]|nr:hypothetical protein [Planctomycetota bacterium]
MRHAPTTAGLTLTEMLVATIVFLVGFVAVFGLFLGGMRFRKLSEDTTRSALAASCIIEEIKLDSGGSATPSQPSDYVGSGFTGTQSPTGNDPMAIDATAKLFAYPASPGIWYRVMSAKSLDPTNPTVTNGDKATVLEMRILVMPYALATGDISVPIIEVAKRLGVTTILNAQIGTSTPLEQIAQELVNRGLAITTDAVITRRPSWLP